MAIHIPPPSKWSHRHIILVTQIGTLVAIAIVAVISMSLSPAHIFFSITDAKAGKVVEDTRFYNFTLVARNRGPRMAVLYGALSAEIWYSQTAWVPAIVDMSVLKHVKQAPRNESHINVSAEYWQSEQASSNKAGDGDPASSGGAQSPPATTNTDWSNCTVVVTAKVWFKAGGISTRSYNIRASCWPVNFGNAAAPVNCKPD